MLLGMVVMVATGMVKWLVISSLQCQCRGRYAEYVPRLCERVAGRAERMM